MAEVTQKERWWLRDGFMERAEGRCSVAFVLWVLLLQAGLLFFELFFLLRRELLVGGGDVILVSLAPDVIGRVIRKRVALNLGWAKRLLIQAGSLTELGSLLNVVQPRRHLFQGFCLHEVRGLFDGLAGVGGKGKWAVSREQRQKKKF